MRTQMGDVIKGKFGVPIAEHCSIECCECGCPLWLCSTEDGLMFGMCPKCGVDGEYAEEQ